MDAPSKRSAAHPDQVPSETLQDSGGQRQASLSKPLEITLWGTLALGLICSSAWTLMGEGRGAVEQKRGTGVTCF